MTTGCHISGCARPADIADQSLDLCARHYRQLTAIVPERTPPTDVDVKAQLRATSAADQDTVWKRLLPKAAS